MDVSIIIVNWNVRDLLRDCLYSIYKETKKVTFEIIVIDNDSSDGSVVMLKSEFPDIRIIENSENRGFAAANNQGILIAKGGSLLFLNPDTMILDDAISKCHSYLNITPRTAMIGCKILSADNRLARSCFLSPSLLNMFLAATYLYKIFPKSTFFGRENLTWWDYDTVRDVEYLRGCFMLVRREAIEDIGMMDERFFMYLEDADWCDRFRRGGWKITFIPHAAIIHHGSSSSKKDFGRTHKEFLESEILFMRRKGVLTALVAICLEELFMALRIPYWVIIWVFSGSRRHDAAMTLKAYLSSMLFLLSNKGILRNNLRADA